jgi:hypothetical protein
VRTKTLSQIGLLGRKPEEIEGAVKLLKDYKNAIKEEIIRMEK